MAAVPQFSSEQPPSAIVAEAGEWLAAKWGNGARYLRQKREVVRRVSGRAEGITLQTSSRSRAGMGTWVWPRIWVTDRQVDVWQRQHPVHHGMFARGGCIFSTLIVNLGLPPDVELFGPLRHMQPATSISLSAFWAALEQEIFPNTKLLWGEPATAAELLPDMWLVFPEPLFWWAVAFGDGVAARTILSRYFRGKDRARDYFDDGRRLAAAGEPAPDPIRNTMIAFGWSAVSTGALTLEEPV
jgi:hypothetical protein